MIFSVQFAFPPQPCTKRKKRGGKGRGGVPEEVSPSNTSEERRGKKKGGWGRSRGERGSSSFPLFYVVFREERGNGTQERGETGGNCSSYQGIPPSEERKKGTLGRMGTDFSKREQTASTRALFSAADQKKNRKRRVRGKGERGGKDPDRSVSFSRQCRGAQKKRGKKERSSASGRGEGRRRVAFSRLSSRSSAPQGREKGGRRWQKEGKHQRQQKEEVVCRVLLR